MREEIGSRASTFRHIFGQSGPRQEWYDWGGGHAVAVAANPKFLALALEGTAGGQVLVGGIDEIGKHGHLSTVRLQDHKGPVNDVKWNLFNDNVLASASTDCTIKIWHISDELKTCCVRTLSGHTRRVDQIEWHTTVDNVILSTGSDSRIVLWDVEAGNVIYEISEFLAVSIAFSPNSALFVAASKQTHRINIFDARTGTTKQSTFLPHDGNTAPRVFFASCDRVIAMGNNRMNRRQLSILHLSSFSEPATIVDIDGASGHLTPIYDNDLRLLYVTGRGDSTIRFYEILERIPYVVYLGETVQTHPHSVIGAGCKRDLNLESAEIMRIYRMFPQGSLVVQPLSLIVPRRADSFQADLYPPTRGPTAAMSLAEWRAGLDSMPVPLQLRPGQPVATSKPVILKGGSISPKLVTSDINNDKKFRFLSQVTKPDYRSVEEREDCDEIMKLEKVKQALQSSRESSQFSADIGGLPLTESLEVASSSSAAVSSREETPIESEGLPEVGDAGNVEDGKVESDDMSEDMESQSEDCGDVTTTVSSLPLYMEQHPSSSMICSLPGSNNSPRCESPPPGTELLPESSSSLKTPISLGPPGKVERMRLSSSPQQDELDYLEDVAAEECDIPSPPPTAPSKRPIDELISVETNPFKQYFEAEQAIKVKRRESAHIKDAAPLVSPESDEPIEMTMSNGNTTDERNGSASARSVEEQKILENTVGVLEKQLRKTDARVKQLERICEMQQRDMESLRFEIEWKDERIEYLQKALTQMEAGRPVVEADEDD